METLQGAARHDEAARERFLAMMSNQALRMSRLIDDLLSLSRIEMKQHLPPRDEVDLNDVAREAAQTIAPLAEAARITLGLSLIDRPARVRGERDELLQALQNLMQNAIKYGRPQGHVRVALTAAHDGRRLTLAVTDEGAGIPPQHLPRLTERFYRIDRSRSRASGGTGLGLAIVKHVLQRHQGRLEITSTLGEGSTFSCFLPASRIAEASGHIAKVLAKAILIEDALLRIRFPLLPKPTGIGANFLREDQVALAIDAGLPVQQVPYATLRKQLLADGQVLEHGR